MTTDIHDPDTRLAAAHSAAMHYQRARRRLEKRAGRAIRSYDSVVVEQADAIDVFSDGPYGNMTNEEIAKAAGRIQRLSNMLIAADALPGAKDAEQTAKEHLQTVRDEVGAPTVRPVGRPR